MNELLGWYGYDKVDLRDSEANEIRNYRERRQHVSVLKGKKTGATANFEYCFNNCVFCKCFFLPYDLQNVSILQKQ